jgi:hypothetical protein
MMGLIRGIKSAAKGMAGGSLHIEACSSDSIDASVNQAFEVGTRLTTLPTKVGHLALDISHLHAVTDRLRDNDVLHAEVDLSTLGKLSDALNIRLGSKDARLKAPMKIIELSPENILLNGAIDRLGSCTLEILLREHQVGTHANVKLGVDIEPLDIRMVAATQQDELNNLLQDSMNEFIGQFKTNIHTQLENGAPGTTLGV